MKVIGIDGVAIDFYLPLSRKSLKKRGHKGFVFQKDFVPLASSARRVTCIGVLVAMGLRVFLFPE